MPRSAEISKQLRRAEERRQRRHHRPSLKSSALLPLATLALLQSSSLRPFRDAAALALLPSFRGRDSSVMKGGGKTQIMHGSSGSNTAGLTLDSSYGAEASVLWKVHSHRNDDDDENNNIISRGKNGNREIRRAEKLVAVVPYGPVPRGGSPADVVVPSSGGAAAFERRPRQQRPLANTWTNVRTTVRGARRGVRGARRRLVCAVNLSVLRGLGNRNNDDGGGGGAGEGAAIAASASNDAVGRTARSSGRVQIRRKRRFGNGSDNDGATGAGSASDDSAMLAKNDQFSLPIIGRLFDRKGAAAASASQIDSTEVLAIQAAYELAAASSLESSSIQISMNGGASASSSISIDAAMENSYYVIETPLFPIILPKSWEPTATATQSIHRAAANTARLEISVALQEEELTATTTSTLSSVEENIKPSAQLLQAATLPLMPKSLMGSFTGREFYHTESMEALANVGMRMALGQNNVEEKNNWVNWTGEKKTDKFLKDHGNEKSSGVGVGTSKEWYAALDSSQEVLVWAGKFIAKEGFGAELPIIKTTSVIHQSPKNLAELLMDSNRVQVYNKMSLGRTDEKIFQTGIDTQDGAFGDGESKVVRNLTKPPMVSSLIEFVTCMHARKLRPSDMDMVSVDDEPMNGYIVVSRAVTGGEWNADNNSFSNSHGNNNEKRVRNEILLGVNILKAIPGEPNKTEMTTVAHVHSTMIPLMLAKNAGVKGALDFVRDIRALH